MKVILQKRTLRLALRCAQWLLGTAGAFALSYCVMVLAQGWMFQKTERLNLERLLRDRPAAAAGIVHFEPLHAGDLFARLDIGRLGVSVVVIEGEDSRTLRRAAGHIPGTGRPGQLGNIGISAHRDTFFRPLRNIRRDDVITLTTLSGEFRYRVLSTKIVRPDDIAVLRPDEAEILTLVTCYPFYFIGSAPSRFIVRAERVI